MTNVHRVTLETTMLIGAISGLTAAAMVLDASLPSTDLAHTRLCGIALHAEDARFQRLPGPDGGAAVERLDDFGSPVVLRFDRPTAYVDLLAVAPVGAPGRVRAELVAFDAWGGVVDVDRGPAEAGSPVTMQVTADDPVIREAHLRITGLGTPHVLTLSQIDIGARSDYCPLSAAS